MLSQFDRLWAYRPEIVNAPKQNENEREGYTMMELGKLTNEQVLAKLKEFEAIKKEVAERKKAGTLVIEKKRTAPEKTPEYILIASQFKAVIDANMDTVIKFFEASKTTEKPIGNTGINFRVKNEAYYVQVLSQKAMDSKAKERKDAAKAEKEKAKAEKAKAETPSETK
jgi:hypothetical protein